MTDLAFVFDFAILDFVTKIAFAFPEGVLASAVVAFEFGGENSFDVVGSDVEAVVAASNPG